MNWRTKSAMLAVADWLPVSLYYAGTRRLLGSGQMDLSGGIPEAWQFQRSAIEETGARNVIEFGAGQHLGLNLWLSDMLTRQTVVDINRIASLPLVNDVLRQLGQQSVASFRELRDRLGIDYRAPCDLLNLQECAEYDANMTSSVWEHIPAKSIPALIAKLRKIIKPGGHIIAHIDYSDHYAHGDGSIDRVHFLSVQEREWRWHNHKNLYQSRLRHAHYRQIFTSCGLQIVSEEASNYVERPQRPCLPELLTGDPTDLATTGRWILLSP